MAKTETYGLLDYVRLYFAMVLDIYCKVDKRSCASHITRHWLTKGISDSQAILASIAYNERVYNKAHTWGQNIDDINAHKQTMFDWYGIKLFNDASIIKIIPLEKYSFDDMIFSWLNTRLDTNKLQAFQGGSR